MPHVVIHCSEQIIKLKSAQEIIQNVYNKAASTGGASRKNKSMNQSILILYDWKLKNNNYEHFKN